MGYKSNILMGGALLLFGAIVVLVELRAKNNNNNGNNSNNTTNGNSMNNSNNSSLPRGYRNNNPLNLRISNNNWVGKVYDNTDGSFEQFTSMAYGYRAALVTIRNYVNKYGLNTISKIISRWAPSNENNTAGYIQRVCSITGFAADMVVDPNNKQTMCKLIYAMSIVENGNSPKPDEEAINNGWSLYTMSL